MLFTANGVEEALKLLDQDFEEPLAVAAMVSWLHRYPESPHAIYGKLTFMWTRL